MVKLTQCFILLALGLAAANAAAVAKGMPPPPFLSTLTKLVGSNVVLTFEH